MLASAEVARLFGWRRVFLGLLPVVACTGSMALPALLRLGRPAPADGAAQTGHSVTDGLRTAAGAGLADGMTGTSAAFGSCR
jgi:hypothetical protein